MNFLETIITQWPIAVITFITLILYLHLVFEDRIRKLIREEIKGVREEFRSEISKLRRDIGNFNEALLELLHAKQVITSTELIPLRMLLRSIVPYEKTKYYTREVREKLEKLLEKDIDEYTWEDVYEFEKIIKALEDEYDVSKREELLDYASKLRVFVMHIRARLIVRGIFPKRKEEERK